MLRTDFRNRLAVSASLCLVLAVLPACSSTSGQGLLRRDSAGVTVVPAPEPLPQRPPYVAYRPVTPIFRPKTMVVSGYAGSNYPSTAPGAVLSPTQFRAMTGRPDGPSWFGLGSH